MVVVTAGVSGMVVVVGCAGGVTGWFAAFGPSTPVLGSGGAWPVAPLDGVAVSDCGAAVTSGGAFW